jgi:aryl sulfotransferase
VTTHPPQRVFWLASYPRSGNSWVRHMLAAYMFGPSDRWGAGKRAALPLHYYLPRSPGLADCDLLSLLLREQVAARPPRPQPGADVPPFLVLKTHFAWSDAHPLAPHSAGAVIITRHPRDVLLSAIRFHRLRGTLRASDRDYARAFIAAGGDPGWARAGYGTWASHAHSWLDSALFPVLRLRYEDLRADPEKGLGRLLEALGLGADPALARAAVRSTSIDRLREIEARARAGGAFAGGDAGTPFIGRGATGQSLAHIDPGLDAAFEVSFGPSLRALGYACRGAPA